MWTCPHCNEETDDDFQICWTCRIPRGRPANFHELQRLHASNEQPEFGGPEYNFATDEASSYSTAVQVRVVAALQCFASISFAFVALRAFLSARARLELIDSLFSPDLVSQSQLMTFVSWALAFLLVVSTVAFIAASLLYRFRGYRLCIVAFAIESLFWPLGTILAIVSLTVLLRPTLLTNSPSVPTYVRHNNHGNCIARFVVHDASD